MLMLLGILLALGLAQLSHCLCVPEVLHPQTALCEQTFAFKGKITERNQFQTGVSYQVEVLEVFKDTESNLVLNEMITISTLGSLQNGITWLTEGTEYFMTASDTKSIDVCQSYVIEWNSLPLPESVYNWRVADDTFRPTRNCKKCKINYGTPNGKPRVCNYDSNSRCHLYERCYYMSDDKSCAWGKLPQKEIGLDCEEEEQEEVETL